MNHGHQFKDETGNVYGKLTVLRHDGKNHRKQYRWVCQCSCGQMTTVIGSNLRTGNTRSCGCEEARVGIPIHGQHKSTLYRAWYHMKERCSNPSCGEFLNYGGRGISVCARWLDFQAFAADVGDRPSTQHSLERKNNDGNYEPSNVCWATKVEQNNNTRVNRVLECMGTRATLTQWSRRSGIKAATIYSRLKRGWTTEDAVSTPVS